MKDFVVSIEKNQTLVFKPEDKNKILARIEFPEFPEEIFLPLVLKIFQKQKKVGDLEIWMPRKNYLKSHLGTRFSHIFQENGQIGMKTRDILGSSERDFSIEGFDLTHFQEKVRKEVKKNGFQKGYFIKRNHQVGEAQLYKKDEAKRVLLRLDEGLDWQDFVCLALFDEIIERLQEKNEAEILELPARPKPTKKSPTTSQELPKKTPVGGSGKKKGQPNSYQEFVLASYPALKEEEAVEYLDQKGEWGLFCEFMGRKKPMLLNGPTGTGKDTMIRWYAHREGLPFFKCQGHQRMTMRDLEGMWTMVGERPIKSPGPLVLAAVFGGICYIEEIGPISQEILYGLHSALDRKEIVVQSQYGFERIKAHPETRIVASGNLDRRYTLNDFNDAFLERWVQIKLDYPDKERSIEIIISVTGVDEHIAKILTDITFEMRAILGGGDYEKDMGLRGAIDVANAIAAETEQPIKTLVEVCMVNPKATYDEVGLRKELRGIVEKCLGKKIK